MHTKFRPIASLSLTKKAVYTGSGACFAPLIQPTTPAFCNTRTAGATPMACRSTWKETWPYRSAILIRFGSSTREVGMLNASVGITRGNYDLILWGRNITDDQFLVSAFPSVAQPGSFSGYPNAPRT